MADTPIGGEGVLNGTTAATVLAAPASGVQRVVPADGVSIYNADTVSHTYTLQKDKNGTTYVLEKSTSVASLGTYSFGVRVVLDDTDESLEVVYEATATTNESDYNVSAMECD